MKSSMPSSASFEDMVRAFRDTTAAVADGAATRDRVLDLAAQRLRRRILWRRTGPAVAVLLALLVSGTVAWTAMGRWGFARVSPCCGPTALSLSARSSRVTAPLAPPLALGQPTDEPAPSPGRNADGDGEDRAYASAHRAHFVEEAPDRALLLWDRYLRDYSRGALSLEARYNRAVCLMRLGRLHAAARALRPFASGAFNQYRQKEAKRLLDWIAAAPAP